MKKFALFCSVLFLINNAFAYDVPKNEQYYKSQIQNQRFLYSTVGIMNAIQKGNAEAVEMFMKAGFDPNDSYAGTPLIIYAIHQNQPECLEALLNAGGNPETSIPPMFVTAKSINALNYAIKKKSSAMVRSLINHKVDVNKEFAGQLPINRALKNKQSKIVELLLNAKAVPNEKTLKLAKKSKDEYMKDLFAKYWEADEK